MGDLLITLRFQSDTIVRLDTSPGGAYYPFSHSGNLNTDGITVDYDDNALLRISREDSADILAMDGFGNTIPASTWSLPGEIPKIGSFQPGTGDFYVPSQFNGKMWVIPHGSTTPIQLPATGFGSNAIGTAFDAQGNLYVTQNQTISWYKAADLGAWRASGYTGPLAPQLYRSVGVNMAGLVYDGNNTLYIVADIGPNLAILVVQTNTPVGSVAELDPLWPSSPSYGQTPGTHLGGADGLLMDIAGNLWVTSTGGARGMVKLDVAGNVLDFRPLPAAMPGTPDDVAVLGWKLPRPPVAPCLPSATPTSTATPTSSSSASPSASSTATASATPSSSGTVTGTSSATRTATPTATATSSVTASSTATATSSVTATGTFTATATASPTPSSTVTRIMHSPAPTCSSYGPSVQAFYGGNSGDRLADSSGHGHSLEGNSALVPIPDDVPLEGDQWLGEGFNADNFIQVPAGVFPTGGQGAVDFLLKYETPISTLEQLFLVQEPDGSAYLSLYLIQGGYLGADYNSGGQYFQVPHPMVAGQSYEIRVEWDSTNMRVKVDGVVVGQSAGPLWMHSSPSMMFGAFPRPLNRDLHSKLDAIAILDDPNGQVCAPPTATSTATPSISASPSDTPTASPSATATKTATATVTPGCSQLPPYSGQGNVGDLLVTLRFQSSTIVRLDTAPGGSYHLFSSSSDIQTDGIAVDYDDNALLRISRETRHDIEAMDASGAEVAASDWTLPAGEVPKIGSFQPGTGDFYVPSQFNGKMWMIPHGSTAPIQLPATGFGSNAIGTAFDAQGNLYVTQNQQISWYQAADLAAWKASGYTAPLAPLLYRNVGVNMAGLVYDGNNTLYIVADIGPNLAILVVPANTAGLGVGELDPVWPSSPVYAGQTPGTRLSPADGLLMDVAGDLWVTSTGSARGLVKLDVSGQVLDFRALPADMPGTPDDIAVLGWKLPRPPVNPCLPTSTPTPTSTSSGTATSTATSTNSVTPTWTFTWTSSPSSTASSTATPSPSATPTSTVTRVMPVAAPTCSSYGPSVLAFYGGNSGDRLGDSSGHGHSLDGNSALVPIPADAPLEGDQWLGEGFNADNFIQVPAGVFPAGGQGAVDFLLKYEAPINTVEQLFFVQEPGNTAYLSLYLIQGGYFGVDYNSAGQYFQQPHGMVPGQTYEIRVDWDSSDIRVKVNGAQVGHSGVPLWIHSSPAMMFGAFPQPLNRDLQSKLDAIAILDDPNGEVCAPPTPTSTATASPTATATSTVTRVCSTVLPPYNGQGHAGDLAITLRFGSNKIVALDSSPGGLYYPFAVSGDNDADGITVDFDDNAVLRVSREDNHDIEAIDGNGNPVPGATWSLPGEIPKIGSFQPVTGDYYVPSQFNGKMWMIPHGSTTPLLLPPTGFGSNAIGTVFDAQGNLYVTEDQHIEWYQAADLAAWKASGYAAPLSPSVYRYFGVNMAGMVYDGTNTLYVVADIGPYLSILVVPANTPGTSVVQLDPVWTSAVVAPGYSSGDRLAPADGLLMDVNGDLWVTSTGSARGMVKLDVAGQVLDYRPLPADMPGTPDDVAVIGWKLPRPPIPDCSSGNGGGNALASVRARAVAKETPQAWLPVGKDLIVAPNPAQRHSSAFFRLPEAAKAQVVISDLLGARVLSSPVQELEAGQHRSDLDLSALAPGLYFAQLLSDTGQGWQSRASFKMALVP